MTPEPLNEKVLRIEQQERIVRERKEVDARKEKEDSARLEREKRRKDWELEEGEYDEQRDGEAPENQDDSGFEPDLGKRRRRGGEDPDDDDGCVPCRVPRNLLQMTSPLATSLGLSMRQHDSFVRGVYEAMGLDSREMKGSLASAYRWRREGESDLATEALDIAGKKIRERDARVTFLNL